jgi:hypothetical protein
MHHKRKRKKPLRKDLQEIVDRLVRNSFGGKFSSTSQPTEPPPAIKGATPSPAVVFYSYADFLRQCDPRSLEKQAYRYYGMTDEERGVIRSRLGLTHETVPGWVLRWRKMTP